MASFADTVRLRPLMYFGTSLDHPEVVAMLVKLAIKEPFLWAEDRPVHVKFTVKSELEFTIEDDLPPLVDMEGLPRHGQSESLIDARRQWLDAAAALSSHASIEIRSNGHAWRQEITYPGEWSTISRFESPEAGGSHAVISLNPSYFAPGSALPSISELKRDLPVHSLNGTLAMVDTRQ